MAKVDSASSPVVSEPSLSFRTEHRAMIHDVKVDYYGKTMATASSDSTIRLFDVIGGDKYFNAGLLEGHTGPVWSLSWGPPQYGQILASAGADRRVIVWLFDPSTKQWMKVLNDRISKGANCLEFYLEKCTNESDHSALSGAASAKSSSAIVTSEVLHLMVGCSNGDLVHYKCSQSIPHKWAKGPPIKAHSSSVNSLSWNASLDKWQKSTAKLRLVSAGNDDVSKVWEWHSSESRWTCTAILRGHGNAINSVCWAPDSGLGMATIATASADRTVRVWREQSLPTPKWSTQTTLEFKYPVWSVSWNELGSVLAVSFADKDVALFKEGPSHSWIRIASVSPTV